MIPQARRFRELLPSLAVLWVTVVLFCAMLETALRIVYRRSLDFSMEMWKYAVPMKRPVANPRLSFAHVPNRSAYSRAAEDPRHYRWAPAGGDCHHIPW